MFFVGVFGIGSKAKPLGTLKLMECPCCGNQVTMHVTHSYNYPHFFFIPLFKFSSQYIVTCTACASVFEIGPENGKDLERRGSISVHSRELHLLRNNAGRRCPHCRSRVEPEHHYCPSCGRPLE